MKTYTLEITEADNGWIVKQRTGTYTDGSVYVVPQGEDLAQYIKAAIAAGKIADDGKASNEGLMSARLAALQNAYARNMYGKNSSIGMAGTAAQGATQTPPAPNTNILTKLANKVSP